MSAIANLTRHANRSAQAVLVLALCIGAPMSLSLALATIGYGAV
jgi:hypothetical protein